MKDAAGAELYVGDEIIHVNFSQRAKSYRVITQIDEAKGRMRAPLLRCASCNCEVRCPSPLTVKPGNAVKIFNASNARNYPGEL